MRFFFLAVLLMLCCSRTQALSIEWTQGPPMPSARDHLGCGVIGGRLVVAGGAYWQDEKKHFMAETLAYSPKLRKWTKLATMPTPAAYGASAVYRNQLIIAGGVNQGGALKQCIRLVSGSNGVTRWDRLPDMPHAVAGGRGAVVGDEFIVMTGAPAMDEAGLHGAYQTILQLDLEHPTAWTEQNMPKEFAGRIGAALTVAGDAIYLFGGIGIQPDGTLGNFGDAWTYRNGAWNRLRDLPVKARFTAAVAIDSRHIALCGGYSDTFLADVYIHDTEQDSYTKSDAMPLAACNQADGVISGYIYLSGGEDKMKHRSDSLLVGEIRP